MARACAPPLRAPPFGVRNVKIKGRVYGPADGMGAGAAVRVVAPIPFQGGSSVMPSIGGRYMKESFIRIADFGIY